MSTRSSRYAGPCLCVAVAVVALGSGSLASPNGSPRQQSPPTADIYRRDCASCHAADGSGTARGPDLAGAGLGLVDFMVRTGRMPIADPEDQPRRGPPAYDEPTLDALVAYVGQLQGGAVADGPPVPNVDTASGDVAEGAAVWRLNCAACHQWSGSGGAVSDQAAPDVRHATAREIAEAVRAGPGSMPAFGDAAVSHRDLDNLAAYMREDLDRPSDPGGWPIGHIGPVAEGAIALVAGLGLLAIVCRLLGEGRDPSRRTSPGTGSGAAG